MIRMNTAALTCVLSTVCFAMPSAAQTGDPGIYRIDADKNTLLDFGHSWKRSALAPAGESCVEIDLSKAKELGDKADETSYTLATTSQEIADQMNLSVDAKFSAVTPAGKAHAHASVDFANSFKTNSSSISLVVKALKTNGTVRVEGVKLKDKYLKMLEAIDGLKQFESECGDGFVIGKKQGALFVGVANANSKSTESHSKFDMAVGGGLDNPTFGVEANVGFGKAMSKAFGSKNITVNVYGNYDFSSGEKASSPEELERIWKQWKPGNNFADVSYQIADYKKWVSNWPASQKESPWKTLKEENLDEAVSAAWDLMTLVQEADFTAKNHKLFAIGISKKVRDREIKRVEGLRDAWTTKKHEAATYALALMEGKNATRPGFLKNFSLESARGDLPVRYVADCSGISVPTVELAGTSNGTTLKVPFDSKGDANLGKAGLLVTGKFVVKLDKKKRLSGAFESISFRECKKHKHGKKKGKCNKLFKTEFKKKNALPSFDAPMKKANPQYGDVSLATCSLKGGTKTYKIKKYFTRFGRQLEIPIKPKGGPLKGLVCDVDKKTATKSRLITCTLQFRELSGFVSSVDLAVEKDGKKARKSRKEELKSKAKKGRKKAKNKKKKNRKFFGKKAKGKKTKAKRGKQSKKGNKAKKKCKKKCKKKKGKKRKACMKKCK